PAHRATGLDARKARIWRASAFARWTSHTARPLRRRRNRPSPRQSSVYSGASNSLALAPRPLVLDQGDTLPQAWRRPVRGVSGWLGSRSDAVLGPRGIEIAGGHESVARDA